MAKVNQRKEELRRLLTDSKTGQLVTPERREILELDILELAERLQHGALKPTRVLQAYQVNTEQPLQYSQKNIRLMRLSLTDCNFTRLGHLR